MLLNKVKNRSKVKIKKLNAEGKLLYKLLDMGFVEGAIIEVVREAPLYDPMELKIHNYNLTLRKNEANLIEIEMI
ncbi:FeoA family protein [Arcobacter porcinus]|uniref:Ferrous iron transport protein A n=1 Tax=Arcobacter porcinus TaxID=1935204 RepID=A0ABX2YAJ6_9BACT|nr:ferrous iron transport protein A [Arcobacter porcinus]OCL81769.1 Ferrous iron transport protein A [Arcobacter porcinus]OCL82258.1 Ferrous iron transport protein A [Arcobacter porcinus]OCL90759.1 Ferrous iron transport protein A [Arcobacter porcinus]